MKKIYIAGPMTGHEYFNFPAFDVSAYEYRQRGFEVFSPADHDRSLLGRSSDWMPAESDSVGPWKAWGLDNAPTLRDMLGADLAWIAAEATDIHMLSGWERSNGARAEHALAVALGLDIHYG